MSTQVDYCSVDETPVERDPTNEEMAAAMTEREFLCDLQKRVGELQFLASCLFQEIGMRLDTFCPPWEDAGCRACGMHWEACCCPVSDPFADQ